MMDVMEDREVWRLNLELLPPQPLTEKRAMKKEEEEKYYKLTNRGGSIQYWLITNHLSQISFHEPPSNYFSL